MAGVGQVSSHGGKSWGAGGSVILRPPQGSQEQSWQSSAEHPSSTAGEQKGRGMLGKKEDPCP